MLLTFLSFSHAFTFSLNIPTHIPFLPSSVHLPLGKYHNLDRNGDTRCRFALVVANHKVIPHTDFVKGKIHCDMMSCACDHFSQHLIFPLQPLKHIENANILVFLAFFMLIS